jgi:glucokinase
MQSSRISPSTARIGFLAVDIGATNTRSSGCVFHRPTGTIQVLWTDKETTGSRDNLQRILIRSAKALQTTEGIAQVWLAAIGCPGVVSEDGRQAAITYLGPSSYLDIASWLEGAGVQKVVLYNDLECGAYGVVATPISQMRMLSGHLGGGIPESFIVGMPGTGLGVGYWNNGRPFASEGGHGHIAISPRDPVEMHIWEGLLQKDDTALPVYDDVACGKGLGALARILNDLPEGGGLQDLESTPGDELPVILSQWAKGTAQRADFARKVFSYFGTFLGRGLQLPVLTTMPGALFLAGTLAIENVSFFQEAFLRAFQSHRYHAGWLESLPVALVANRNVNLDGAIEAARRELIR